MAWSVIRCISFVILLTSLISAHELRGTVNTTLGSLESDAMVLFGSQPSHIWEDGQFIIRDILPGHHILSVLSRRQVFPQYLVQIQPDFEIMITLHTPGTLPNLSRPQLEHLIPQPLVIQSKGLIQYGEPKIPFSAKRIVMGNPILLVLALGAAMAVGLPKIMSMLDPEVLSEVQANQAQLHNAFSADNLGSGLSKYLAGTSAPVQKDKQEMKSINASKKAEIPLVVAPTTTLPSAAKGGNSRTSKSSKKRK